jgi:5-formyltetrahydrofolate cyclo-ligase
MIAVAAEVPAQVPAEGLAESTKEVAASASAEAKQALRRRIRAGRQSRLARGPSPGDAGDLADTVLDLVDRHTERQVCRVAAYESLPTEPPTNATIRRLLEAGYEVVLPVLLPDRDLDWVLAGQPDTRLGVAAISTARVIVAPALAADLAGHRLGQGGGSYDRALARRDPDALVVVLVHDDEVLADDVIPTAPHDRQVDVIVTAGRGVVSRTRAG